MPRSEPQVDITWHDMTPSPAQLASWQQLWDRLLGHSDPGQKREPQDQRDPEAGNVTAGANGSVRPGDNYEYTNHAP
jgi:hypothetical protein